MMEERWKGLRVDARRFWLREELLALIDKGRPLTEAEAAQLLGVSRSLVHSLRRVLRLPWPCRACGRPVPFPSGRLRRRLRCQECARILGEAMAVAAEAKAAHQAGGPNMGPRRSRRRDQLLALIANGEPLTVTQAAESLGVVRAWVNRLRVALRLPWPCDACGRPVPFEQSYGSIRPHCQECAATLAEAAAVRRAEAERAKTHCRRCGVFIGAYRHPRGGVMCRPCGLRLGAAWQSVLRYRKGHNRGGFYVDSRRKYPVSDVLEYLEEHGHDGP